MDPSLYAVQTASQDQLRADPVEVRSDPASQDQLRADPVEVRSDSTLKNRIQMRPVRENRIRPFRSNEFGTYLLKFSHIIPACSKNQTRIQPPLPDSTVLILDILYIEQL